MAASDPIGKVKSIILNTADQIGGKYNTTISRGFTVNSDATFGQVDTSARALTALTTNNYVDTTLITEVSVNEYLAD